MALKKFARRDVILPAVVFLLTFVVALFSLRLLSLNQEKDERLRAVYAAESTISRVSSQLNRYLAESDFIKKYIESGRVLREEEFAVISSNMQDGSSVIKTHELAKDGVVSQVYPVAGNEAAIGLDMLHNPARKKEANLAKNSGMYTIAGPFELVQGGTGALLFDPIYTYSEKGERSFWGFSILVLQWDDFIEEVELDKMEDAGYRYQIWKKDPYTGEKIVIAESEEDFPGNALEVACSVPNDTWYFEIIPKAGWFSDQQLLLGIVIATIIGMMAAYACWELMNRHQKDLQHEAALEKSAQEARAANEAKTRFLFNMSHDIRTPMNAIIGFSELLEKHIDEKDKVLDYTEKIRSSSAFLLSLINYVLEMARIESGKVTLEETAVEAGSIFESCVVMVQPELERKHQTMTVEKHTPNPYLYMDTSRILEVILNLVSNAIKYTGDGGHIRCAIRQLPSDREGWCVQELSVADNGIGMSEEFQQHIFEAFARERSSTVSGVAGSGLGMGIVKKLVDLMNGSIDIQSKLGEGSTFTVYIPCRLARQEDAVPKRAAERVDKTGLAGRRILLAEDNDLNAEITAELMGEEGLLVDRAENGAHCLEMLEKAPAGMYDAILMDVQMPVLDGYEATQKIRRLTDPWRANIPIIAITANAFAEDRQRALEVGMDDHVAKPIDMAKLIPVLQKQLHKHDGEAEEKHFSQSVP